MNPRILANNLSGYAPPPTFLKYKELVRTDPLCKEEIFDKIEIMPKGGIKFCDEKIQEKMKGVVRDVLSQAASNVFSGQSVIGISLPVRIFEPRSLLERICDWYGFGPVFLKRAGTLVDPMERFKLCVAFALSSIYCGITQ